MSFFLYEPRSKIDYYDDSDSGGSEPGCSFEMILYSPFLILGVFLMSVLPILVMTGYFFHDVYTTLKRTVSSGKLPYPILTYAGIGLTYFLSVSFLSRPEKLPIKPIVYLILALGFILIFTILPVIALSIHWLIKLHLFLKEKFGRRKSYSIYIGTLGLCLTAIVIFWCSTSRCNPLPSTSTRIPDLTQPLTSGTEKQTPRPTNIPVPTRTITILVDDFKPQPYQGDDIYFFNRLEGDRGALNNSRLDWGVGQVAATITTGNSWGGIWMSLNHPIREDLPINFSAILPPQILPAYQAKIIGITVHIAGGTPKKTFRIELKDSTQVLWKREFKLLGGQETLSSNLPVLQNISQLVFVLDHVKPGDYIVIDRVTLTASTPVKDIATAAFVWSYGMLLNNWNSSTGLVRDKAKDASGEFDAIQATGSLAAATAIAGQLGIISREDANLIVAKIGDTLLNKLPTNHGLWPHWVKLLPDGTLSIVPNTEWSSVDTVIAAIGLLDAQSALGLDTSGTERILRAIEWQNLVTEKGISHGYTYANELIPYAWDTFGGESWLVELAYAGATGEVAHLAYPSAPTANGSGFIDELAWLFVLPPSEKDYWGTDWPMYMQASAEKQAGYFKTTPPDSCFAKSGLYGLSAAEVPAPARVPKESMYQAFGLGGQFASVNDGSALLGVPAIAPHYSAMIASRRSAEALRMWDWLITQGIFSPLNNIESLAFPSETDCNPDNLEWNQLKGSWNLSLQSLGWGRYLAELNGQIPAVWQATKTNPLLHQGYRLLSPNEPTNTVYVPKPGESTTTVDMPNPGETPLIFMANGNISCDEEPLYRWRSPGIYRYEITDFNGRVEIYFSEQLSRLQNSIVGQCNHIPWVNYGEMLEGLPVSGSSYGGTKSCYVDSSIPPGNVSIIIKGVENINTRLGTFQAVKVEATQKYYYPTMNNPHGTVLTSEWYVCGAGVIYATISHVGSYQGRNFQKESNLVLISFTHFP